MSKSVEIPANDWSNTKLLLNPLMTKNKVVDDVIKIWTGFIIGNPASIYDFELFIFKKGFDRFFDFFILVFVPHTEKTHFRNAKSSFWVFWQLGDYWI